MNTAVVALPNRKINVTLKYDGTFCQLFLDGLQPRLYSWTTKSTPLFDKDWWSVLGEIDRKSGCSEMTDPGNLDAATLRDAVREMFKLHSEEEKWWSVGFDGVFGAGDWGTDPVPHSSGIAIFMYKKDAEKYYQTEFCTND